MSDCRFNPCSHVYPPVTVRTASYSQAPTPTFTIGARYTFISITNGGSATSTLTAKSLNGFAGTVTLTATVAPQASYSPTASFSMSSLTLTTWGSASTTITISTGDNGRPGFYLVTVAGNSGTKVASVQIQIQVTGCNTDNCGGEN